MGDRGLTFELTPQVANELRNTRKNTNEAELCMNQVSAEANHQCQVQQSQEDEELSLTAPATLPILLVNVERLVGYVPTSVQEAQDLKWQVQCAILADTPADILSEEKDEDQLATFFEERTKEMFESGVAQHADTSQNIEPHLESFRFVAIDYPTYLSQHDSESPTVVNTSHVWKRLLQNHNDDPLLDRIMTHLRNCSRPLLWKDAMRSHLLRLTKEEERKLVAREQEGELYEWRTTRRKQQLEKLYSVRETLQHQLEVSSFNLKSLERDRDEQVAIHMRMKQLQGLESFDFSSTVFSFPVENDFLTGNILGMKEESDSDEEKLLVSDEEKQLASDEDISERSFVSEAEEDERLVPESSEDDSQHDTSPIIAASGGELSATSSSIEFQRRSKRTASKHRQRSQEALIELKHKEKLEAAQIEEERVRELCTTYELKSALAIQSSLENRLKQVDDLLESLQEEEWIEEEAAESLQDSDEASIPKEDKEEPHVSVLDQILAMILGATPPPLDSADCSRDEHARWLEKEHLSLRNDWKQRFGCLPPAVRPLDSSNTSDRQQNQPSSSTFTTAKCEGDDRDSLCAESQQERLRTSFGIENNDTSDWDEESSESALAS